MDSVMLILGSVIIALIIILIVLIIIWASTAKGNGKRNEKVRDDISKIKHQIK